MIIQFLSLNLDKRLIVGDDGPREMSKIRQLCIKEKVKAKQSAAEFVERQRLC